MSEKTMLPESKFFSGKATLDAEARQLDLPPDLIHYCRTIQRRYLNPVVEMKDGVCMGCYITLSSGQRQHIENTNGYGVCESCGRILYFEEL